MEIPFTGRLTYDLAPTAGTTALFVWEPPYDPSIGLDVTVGDQFFSSDDADPFLIGVEQGVASDYFFTASIPDAPFSLFLSDSSRTAFDSSDLPTDLALEDFDQAQIGQDPTALPGAPGRNRTCDPLLRRQPL